MESPALQRLLEKSLGPGIAMAAAEARRLVASARRRRRRDGAAVEGPQASNSGALPDSPTR